MKEWTRDIFCRPGSFIRIHLTLLTNIAVQHAKVNLTY
jgi:hypothetical protein